jgi:hypothetical protein
MLVMEEYHTKVVCMHKQNSEEVPFPGHLTSKSDVCSFRVVLLELMIGRRSMDKSRSAGKTSIIYVLYDSCAVLLLQLRLCYHFQCVCVCVQGEVGVGYFVV